MPQVTYKNGIEKRVFGLRLEVWHLNEPGCCRLGLTTFSRRSYTIGYRMDIRLSGSGNRAQLPVGNQIPDQIGQFAEGNRLGKKLVGPQRQGSLLIGVV